MKNLFKDTFLGKNAPLILILLFVVMSGILFVAADAFYPNYANAQPQQLCPNGDQAPDGDKENCPKESSDSNPSVLIPEPERESSPECDPSGDTPTKAEVDECLKQNQIVQYINITINFLSAGVGIFIVIMIIIGGIQYSASGGNPQASAAAIKRITSALLALITYIFLFALLQWLVPGGL